jgi:hypothetical protein
MIRRFKYNPAPTLYNGEKLESYECNQEGYPTKYRVLRVDGQIKSEGTIDEIKEANTELNAIGDVELGRMINSIIRYTKLLNYEPELLEFENCIFIRDFGPWKFGQTAKYIWISFEAGIMQEYSRTRSLVRSCRIELVALT